ncbi:DUF547 domain-containing protein [Oscillatoria sp. CS-180]|uniref:DUF547 domain-containing protein n=1 Tax=Oscillatoria sp. CS-180 TaxID=3021720 RepID=UPI00232AB018|nr:DUF547 domain-containing protein [Oscillatoria sp. CS-180]MDB9529146.1 DUF547 domain-containing protein [Oscillatoria sp. CS-180]
MIDFTAWDHLLQAYVNDQGQVDYARWQQESVQELEQWLQAVRQTDLTTLEQNSAIAFLINLYNALTIRQVLAKYPIDSIRPDFLGIPNWLAFLRFFTRKIYALSDRTLSLNNIEHDILRQRFQEPRIHFALVCASTGCPLLRSEAYCPDRLAAQLDDDAHRFINNPQKVRYEADSHTLWCSKIFKWYKTDFLAHAKSIPSYINGYYDGTDLPNDVAIAYLPYSWSLNQRMSS